MFATLLSDLKSYLDPRAVAAPLNAIHSLDLAKGAVDRIVDLDGESDGPSAPTRVTDARGVYRNDETSGGDPTARVRFKSGDIDVLEEIYREVGIEPPFDTLPTRAQYLASQAGD